MDLGEVSQEVWGDVIAQAVEKETPFSSLCTAFLPTWLGPPPLVLTKTLCDLLYPTKIGES